MRCADQIIGTAQRLAAFEKHRHHDAVQQVVTQVAPRGELRIQQRMRGEIPVDHFTLHVDGEIATQRLEVARHHQPNESRDPALMADAGFGRRRKGAQAHAAAFVDQCGVTHLLASAGLHVLPFRQLSQHAGACAGGELRLLCVVLLGRAGMLVTQRGETARARDHLVGLVEQQEVHAQMRRQLVFPESVARYRYSRRAQQRVCELRMQSALIGVTRGNAFATASGTGTKCTRRVFGSDRTSASTFSSNRPGTSHSKGYRIVELAGLADHDRAGADDQDRGDVGSFGHRLQGFKAARAGTQKKGAHCASPWPAPSPRPARRRYLDQNRRGGKGGSAVIRSCPMVLCSQTATLPGPWSLSARRRPMGLMFSRRKEAAASPWLSVALLVAVMALATQIFKAHRSSTGAFGTRRSTDEPRVWQEARARQGGRGREATAPWQIPWRGWKDILWRTYEEISEDRLLAIAAAWSSSGCSRLFPAITAFVSLYGLFADGIDDQRASLDARRLVPGGGARHRPGADQPHRRKGEGKLGLGFALASGWRLERQRRHESDHRRAQRRL